MSKQTTGLNRVTTDKYYTAPFIVQECIHRIEILFLFKLTTYALNLAPVMEHIYHVETHCLDNIDFMI